MTKPAATIKPWERDAIIQALKAGVVPKLGLRHIQVGRSEEVKQLARDVDRVRRGGAAMRFVIGEYGSGKTFFLNMIRLIALEKGMLVLSADLTPDRRLAATGGQARLLYAEMTRNASTRTKPEGGAMVSVVERFAARCRDEATSHGREPADVIRGRLAPLKELAGGYDFADVIALYWEGFARGREDLCSAALRWLRGEYSTKTEARNDLGVRSIVSDGNVYDRLKLLASFVREAGYEGLFVCLDEMVNIYNLTSPVARKRNFEQILMMFNDVLQGTACGLGFLMAGTPDFLNDNRRGLWSYEALQSRLSENKYARDGLVDLSGPVIRLENLAKEDIFVLLSNIREVMQPEGAVPDEAIVAFMQHCKDHLGDACFRTPRRTSTEFVNLLSVLEQNPRADWRSLIGELDLQNEHGDDADGIADEGSFDELASFRL